MIISASRRTDIPAFYSKWMMNRLHAGYVLVPNPRNPLHFSRIALNPQSVDCIVFWTKSPAPMLSKLKEISAMGYPFYFQFTLTPYGRDLEQNLPLKTNLIQTFQALSRTIGAERVVWRYDPVILTDRMGIEFHLQSFKTLAGMLEGYTHRCIFSFLDLYPKVTRSLRGILVKRIQQQEIMQIAEGFSAVAQKHQMKLFTCCESDDLSRFGIAHAACIDPNIIESILGCPIRVKKDTGQRPGCGCVESIDIGSYDCCRYGCRYCYATSTPSAALKNAARHDPCSPTLLGHLPDSAIVTERKMVSIQERQMKFPSVYF
jgi:hypothetical protein